MSIGSVACPLSGPVVRVFFSFALVNNKRFRNFFVRATY